MNRFIGCLSVCSLLMPTAFAASEFVPEFGRPETRKIQTSLTANDGLSLPRDLKFNPTNPTELWIVNQESEGVVIADNAGTSEQKSQSRVDAYAEHFMSQVSSLAFGENAFFASCQESRNEAVGFTDFMGPTLWTSDLDIFANVNQKRIAGLTCGSAAAKKQLLGSHMDMLHQSPWCMGIAHAHGNAYWVFDGKNGNIVLYDFVEDHGPGESDHSDGQVFRYIEAKVSRVEGIPSHMQLDADGKWLYLADTGTGRVMRLDTSTGSESKNLPPRSEPLAKYVAMTGATYEVFAQGLRQPSGLVLHDGRLFVSDFATGEIVAYSLDNKRELARVKTGARGIMGLTIANDGKLWFVDSAANKVARIEP